MKKILQHKIEAALLRGFYAFLRLLPLDTASQLGGWLARHIGPLLKAHRTAQDNLARFMPELSAEGRKNILRDMWDNLGRVAAEIAFLGREELASRVTSSGIENLPEENGHALFFSGHFGNWELLPYVAWSYGHPLTLVYRKANNPYVDALIASLRSIWSDDMFPKGPAGAVKMARTIKKEMSIAMLIDQKMNDGIAVPFFGIDAMTAPALAQMALRYDLPIIPASVIRSGGAHFVGTVHPAIQTEKTGDTEKDILAIMTAINATLEGWIRERPAQWFWVHQRWPKV